MGKSCADVLSLLAACLNSCPSNPDLHTRVSMTSDLYTFGNLQVPLVREAERVRELEQDLLFDHDLLNCKFLSLHTHTHTHTHRCLHVWVAGYN